MNFEDNLTPEEEDRVKEIGRQLKLSVKQVRTMLLRRGLAAYHPCKCGEKLETDCKRKCLKQDDN